MALRALDEEIYSAGKETIKASIFLITIELLTTTNGNDPVIYQDAVSFLKSVKVNSKYLENIFGQLKEVQKPVTPTTRKKSDQGSISSRSSPSPLHHKSHSWKLNACPGTVSKRT